MRVKIPRFYLVSILLVTLITTHLSQGSPVDDDFWKHYDDDDSRSLLQNSNESLEEPLLQLQEEGISESTPSGKYPATSEPSTSTNSSQESTTPTELTTPTTTQNITIGTSSTNPTSDGITEPSQQTTVTSAQTSPVNDTSSPETSTPNVPTTTTIGGAETTKTTESSSTPRNTTDGTEPTTPTSMIRTSTPTPLTTDLPPLIYIEGGVSTWAVVVISICLSFVGIFTGLYFLRGYLINRRRADQKRLLRSSISSEGFFYGDVTETTTDGNGDRFHENF